MSRIFDSLKRNRKTSETISHETPPVPVLGTIGAPSSPPRNTIGVLVIFFVAVSFAGFVFFAYVQFNRLNAILASQQEFLDKMVAQANQVSQRLGSVEEKSQSASLEINRFSKELDQERNDRIKADEKQEKQMEQNDRFLRAMLDENFASLSRQIASLEDGIEEESYLPESAPPR